ncbi:MAG TPA: hypothetical protein VG125_02025 [Pirellulales bacterium]|nr:hypothetical protein [Pirellulales bacterium]
MGPAVYYSPAGYTAGQTVVFSAQVDAGSLPTGVYKYTFTVTELYPDGSTVVRAYNGQQNVENLDNSSAGAGWTTRGLPRLWPQTGGVSLSDGSGNMYFFTQNPDGSFTRPAGEPGFSTLVKNADGSYALTDKSQNVSKFTSQGFLTSVTDSGGNVTSVSSDANGNPITVTDPEGRVTTFTYANGLLSSVTDFAGRTVTLVHNSAGQLTELDLPNPGNGEAQSVTKFGYDSTTSELTSITESSGTTQFGYNSFRELTQTTAPDGSVSKLNAPLGQGLISAAAFGPNTPAPTPGTLGTQSNPAPLVYASSLAGSQTDENGHVSTFVPGPFGENTSTTDALGNTVQTAYNAQGQAVQVTAPPLTSGGQPLVTVNKYDSLGNKSESDYPDGTKETWQYDTKFNELIKHVDPAGRETDYALDPNTGDILTVTQVGQNGDPNLTTTYTYTPKPTQSGQPPAGLVATEVDPRGIETKYQYNGHGLVTQVTYAVGTADQASVAYGYDSADDLISETDELGRTTNFVVDGLGRTIEQLDPPPDASQPNVRPITQTVFDAKGEVAKTIDPMNRTTYYVYDESSVMEDSGPTLLKVEGPDPTGGTNYTTTQYIYDPAGNRTEEIDPMGRITAFQYNAANQQIAQQDPSPTDGTNNHTFNRATANGPVTSVVYDTAGDPIQQFDPAGNETDNVFDSNAQLLSTTGPAPASGAARPTVTYTYNGDGQIASATNALGATTVFKYDSFGNKIEEDDPSPDGGHTPGPVLKWVYDADWNLVGYTNAMGQTYVYKYNNRNERVEEDDPSPDGGHTSGPVWKWTYDAAGELVQEIDPLGRVSQWVHDGDGNVIQTIAPSLATGGPGNASTTTYDTYDLDGEKTSQTPPAPAGSSGSTTTTWQYDALGDVTQETGPVPAPGQPAPVTQWFYNADQQVVKEIDPLGRVQTTSVDGLGRTTAVTGFDGVAAQYGYDVLSDRTTTSDASGTVTNSFDALGRQTKTVDQAGGVTQMGYDLLGNMTSLVDASGNKTTFQYNALSQQTSDTNQLGASDTYQYNANGQVTQKIDKDGHVRTFQYDDLGQQTAENWLAHSGGASIDTPVFSEGSGGYVDKVIGITVPASTGGTWTLTFNGTETTAPIQWNAPAADVQSALSALGLIGAGNVQVVASTNPAYTFSVTFVGALSGGNGMSLSASSSLTGNPVTVTETQHGRPFIPSSATLNFGLSWRQGDYATINENEASGSSTSIGVPYGYDQSQLQTILDNADPAFRDGTVTGTWPTFTVTYNTVLAAGDYLSGAGRAVVNWSQGQEGLDEWQQVQLEPGVVGGTFTLSFDGATTAPISYNADAGTITSQLAGILGGGNVWVSGSSPTWMVDFTGTLTSSPQPLLGASGSNLVLAVGVNTIQSGSSGPDTFEEITVSASGGTFTLQWNGETTATIDFGAPGWQVQNALNALPGISFVDVSGSGSSQDPYRVFFEGTWSGSAAPIITGDASNLLNTFNTIATSYNADGEITSIGDNYSHYAYTYDGQRNVASVDNAGTPSAPHVVLASQYDLAGNRSSLSATIAGNADFLNSYDYNTLSELTVLTQQQQSGGNTVAPKEIDYAYNAIGQVVTRTAYNFIGTGPRTDIATAAISYNALGLLTSLAYTSNAGANSLDHLSYSYDSLARVSTFTSIDGTATYGYDHTSQLVSAAYTIASGGHQPANLSLTYDPNGNRTAANGTSTTVGADNHLTSDGTFDFTFDADGNLAKRVRIDLNTQYNDLTTVYSWDYANRLTDVSFYNNGGTLTQHVHYAYDVWDHLIERDVDPNGSGTYTQITHYVWDGDNIVLAFNGSGQLINRYLNGPNLDAFDQNYITLAEEDVTSLTSPGTLTFDLPDPQGSVVDVVNSSGSVIDHIVYGPFGAVSYESSPSVSHLASWQGGYSDQATGMVKFGERWEYMADAFWASQDPLGFLAGDRNLSRVVGNNMPNRTDRSGLSPDAGDDTPDDTLPNDAPPDDEPDDGPTKGKRFKQGQAEQRESEIEAAQERAKKDRPSIEDDDEWEGSKKRPKQTRIESTGKSQKGADCERNSRGRGKDRGGFVRIGGGGGSQAPKSGGGIGAAIGRLGAGARGAGAAAGPMILDAGVGVVDDMTGGSFGNLINNTVGSDPSNMLENMKKLATSGHAWAKIFEPCRSGLIYESDEQYIQDYLEDANETAIDQTGNPLSDEAKLSIRLRLQQSITGQCNE